MTKDSVLGVEGKKTSKQAKKDRQETTAVQEEAKTATDAKESRRSPSKAPARTRNSSSAKTAKKDALTGDPETQELSKEDTVSENDEDGKEEKEEKLDYDESEDEDESDREESEEDPSEGPSIEEQEDRTLKDRRSWSRRDYSPLGEVERENNDDRRDDRRPRRRSPSFSSDEEMGIHHVKPGPQPRMVLKIKGKLKGENPANEWKYWHRVRVDKAKAEILKNRQRAAYKEIHRRSPDWDDEDEDDVTETKVHNPLPSDDDEDDNMEDFGGDEPDDEDIKAARREINREEKEAAASKRGATPRSPKTKPVKRPSTDPSRRGSSDAALRMKAEQAERRRLDLTTPSVRGQRFLQPNPLEETPRREPSDRVLRLREREAERERVRLTPNRGVQRVLEQEAARDPANRPPSRGVERIRAQWAAQEPRAPAMNILRSEIKAPEITSVAREELIKFVERRKNYERDLKSESKNHGGWGAVTPKLWIDSIKEDLLEALCKYNWYCDRETLTEGEFQARLSKMMKKPTTQREPTEADVVVWFKSMHLPGGKDVEQRLVQWNMAVERILREQQLSEYMKDKRFARLVIKTLIGRINPADLHDRVHDKDQTWKLET
ncbi:hypothetical protein As57867_002716, partial [Aphanomyces stellatus]